MKEGPPIAQIAALIGDPARANMLGALMSGKALTATELANEAQITRQTASTHLKKLTEGQLLVQRHQGRHRYYALANEEVALTLAGLMGLADLTGQSRTRTGPKDDALRTARACYNHLAGEKGVWLYESLCKQGHLDHKDGTLYLTDNGRAFALAFGIDVDKLENKSSALCRECLDWSARRSHLAGSLGRAFLARFEEIGWVHRAPKSRAIIFTPRGNREFANHFPL